MATDRMGTARRAVTAFFDDQAAAQQAVDDLVAAKVDRHRITLVEGGASAAGEPVAGEPVPSHDKGVWQTVKDLFMADEDRHAYGEGLRRGGFLLSVTLSRNDGALVVEILDREGAIDMDARQADWELEGWNPARASADLRALSEGEVRTAVEPVGAVGPAFGSVHGSAAPALGPAASLPPEDVRAALEPAGAVGPAFAAGKATREPAPGEPARRVVRDTEAEGLRLRSYVESHDRPDPTR